jgi:hypothetical protein
MATTSPTRVQLHFLMALAALTKANGSVPPTLAELAAHLSSSKSRSPASWLRNRLAARGYVTYERYRARSLRITPAGRRALARARLAAPPSPPASLQVE